MRRVLVPLLLACLTAPALAGGGEPPGDANAPLPRVTLNAAPLGLTGSTEELAAVPREVAPEFFPPRHVRVTFPGQGDPRAQLNVYPVAGLLRQYPEAGPFFVRARLTQLRDLLRARPALSSVRELPYLPLPNAAQVLHAAGTYVTFPGGSGIRYLTLYRQDFSPYLRREVLYTFQGLTDDGRYSVSFTFPVAPAFMRHTPTGYQRITWDEALSETVSKIREIQAKYGKDSFAMLSGVSLTNEKSYLVGKFARLALQTANLDYNGRLCMVSAGAGNKKAYGIDRSSNHWEDITQAKVIFIIGTNIAECFPITTDYIWRARDNGARIIYADPRMVPMARTADLFLPLRVGSDSALLMAMLHVLIRDGLIDEEFIREHTTGFAETADAVSNATPEWAAGITGIPAAKIEQAARWYGEAETGMILHARGLEHQTKGVDNVVSCANLALATGKIGKPGCGHSTITGQGNGQGGREHGHKCDQLPGNRDITNPEHRAYIAQVCAF